MSILVLAASLDAVVGVEEERWRTHGEMYSSDSRADSIRPSCFDRRQKGGSRHCGDVGWRQLTLGAFRWRGNVGDFLFPP